ASARLSQQRRIGGKSNGRPRAVRADPFEGSSITLEEIKTAVQECSVDRCLAGPERCSAPGSKIDHSDLARERIDDHRLLIRRHDAARRWQTFAAPDAIRRCAIEHLDRSVVRDEDSAIGNCEYHCEK